MTNDTQVPHFYAVWKLREYSITYHLGDHAASDTHDNPTSYSVASGADIVLKDLAPESGFQFGGWYTDADFAGEKVTTISLQDQKDYTLYAKWEHGGTFSVSQTKVDGYKVTYTVTRTIPAGAVGTAASQNVYVRTQNGTAYGAAVEVAGQDKYHFIHNQAVLSFGPNDTSKTFVVTEKDASLDNDAAAGWQIGGKARNYRVEIYQVKNSAGGVAGMIGTGVTTRTMPVASQYQLTAGLYTQVNDYYLKVDGNLVSSYTFGTSEKIIEGHTVSVEGCFTGDMNNYCNSIGGMGYTFQYRFDISDHQVVADILGNKSGVYIIGIPVYNPGEGSGKNAKSNGTYETEKLTLAGTVLTRLDMKGGNGGNTINGRYARGTVKNLKTVTTRVDTAKPVAKSAAPLAVTSYKQGDTAYITVIYSEPINTISGNPTLTLSSRLAAYFENPTYVDNGAGTNALVFRVTAKKDISEAEIQNVVNAYLTFPVSGAGGSFIDNVGSVSVTVKDILGN